MTRAVSSITSSMLNPRNFIKGRTARHHQVVEPLGAGGMVEVWRARDLSLHRDAVLEALPEEVAGDSERRARFNFG